MTYPEITILAALVWFYFAMAVLASTTRAGRSTFVAAVSAGVALVWAFVASVLL